MISPPSLRNSRCVIVPLTISNVALVLQRSIT